MTIENKVIYLYIRYDTFHMPIKLAEAFEEKIL